MKTGEDFRKEFPDTDDGFRDAIDHALQETEKTYCAASSRLRLSVTLMLVLLLFTSAAVAATIHRFAIQDFTLRNPRANLSEEALSILATDFQDVAIPTDWADLVLTEAIYDGMAVYMLLEVIPNHPEDMVIPNHSFPENRASFFGSSYPEDLTIEEYAAQLGYAHVLALMCDCEQTTAHYYDSFINDDGSTSIMWWSFVKEQYRNQPYLRMDLSIHPERDRVAYRKTKTTLTLRAAGETEFKSSPKGESAVFENAGVRITGVKVYKTPMSAYVLADYEITDEAKYESYISNHSFCILDEQKEAVPKGAHPLSFRRVRYDNRRNDVPDQYYFITNLLFDTLPEQITIGEYNGTSENTWSNDQTYTFSLK